MPRERRLRGINSSAVRHRISFEDEDIDIESVLERTKTRVFEIIREHAARYDANVKWYIVLNVLLYKLVVLDDKVDEYWVFLAIRTGISWSRKAFTSLTRGSLVIPVETCKVKETGRDWASLAVTESLN
ncbi:uncharacterized protein LOC120354669 [Nilaparvata lugens]|uniref:uncharacterized protein LOC120354669 n=1 Tax=Nilaparvata lugens TaxID=108931 RepID=UPI00193DEE08|nr:uncharacterized protein LOC120354669 [Nilaparvata lugens]